jgi:glyoxylase-like metal-dependent hydrolase (beta-lactamase superfamily II)
MQVQSLFFLLSYLSYTLAHTIHLPRNAEAVYVRNVSDSALYYSETINPSTYRVINHDSYAEYPFIYVKLYPEIPLALVVDTGVGAQNNAEGTEPQQLKDFIETSILPQHPVPCRKDSQYQYLVFCTHCHFDHIGGIQAFSDAGAEIVASSFNRSFLAPENLDADSLCSAFGTVLPEYQIDRFVADGQRLKHHGKDLGLVVLQTPGHTPDSLALFDEHEQWIFIGDTLYQRVQTMPWGEVTDLPIILVAQSHWGDYVNSLHKLLNFTHQQTVEKAIKLSSGHTTSGEPAVPFVQDAITLIERITKREVPIAAERPGDQVAPGGTLGDENFVLWQDEGEPLFGLLAPKWFIEEF